ncbi:MAG: peptidoglycan recognition family protein [Kofleriaceae bacterium]
MRQLRLCLIMGVIACAERSPTAPEGSLARSLEVAADEAGVPRDLVIAIAIEEDGLSLPQLRIVHDDDHVPVAGALELRHGRLDTLALGASLLGTTEEALRADTDLATRAGARVLATLGAQHGAGTSYESWRTTLEVMSGMDDANAQAYAGRVLAILQRGGTFPARAGETVQLAAHAELATLQPVARLEPANAPDFAGAIWFTTSCTNKCDVGRPLGNAAVNKIVIHDTEGGWDGSVATLQNDAGKSVHYIIDRDGSRVGQFRHETDTTWHAGNYYYNETSVGIEHVGVAADPAGYETGLYDTSRALVTDIRTRWNVPLDRRHIIGHYQVPDGTAISQSSAPCAGTLDECENSASFGGAANHRDPGYNWQWCQYMEKLGGTCACNDAWQLWNCTTDKTEAVRCHDGNVEIEHCTDACQVMAIGTDDVCNVAPDSGSDTGSDATGSDYSNPDQGASDDATHDSGCSTTGGGASLPLLFALGLLIRRRRR